MGYYFIAIGGSGAKVMESLTHLCAAGLLPNKEKQERLYVLSVDPDIGNGNLRRSSAALNNLAEFQELDIGTDTPLFKTEVEIARPFPWSPTEQNKKLDDIMSYQSYKGTPIGDLYETLFTKKERDMRLNEGFRGRPSVGAAVLSKKASLFSTQGWEDHADAPWNKFARLVKQDAKNGQMARIFLVGSVFGGTGAAGMPTIARLLRQEFKVNFEEGNVILGGALILPYFSFSPTRTGGDIIASSENFLMNTKAALRYYSQEYSRTHIYDTMYFVGDNKLSRVDHFSPGAADQNNDAHIVDFYGAMAAIDFFSAKPDALKDCSFITHADEDRFVWSDFPDIQGADGKEIHFKDRFAQFVRFIFAYVYLVKPVLSDLASGKEKMYKYPWYADYLQNVDTDTSEVKNFDEYTESFVRWLSQLESSEQNRSVEFVRQDTFSANPVGINPGVFSSCIYEDNSNITMQEIFTRLAEHPEYDDAKASGFGRFLRALYDCCAKD